MPSNEGRGYVLRRIMRRAMRHAHILGAREPLLARLVPALVREMGQAYPELVRAEALMTETLRLEERRFQATLDRGLKLLEDETGKLGEGGTLAGDVAFKLYDTYGFPLDLTADVLRGQGKTVDNAGFELAMAKQRADARRAWAGSGEAATEQLWFDLRDRLGGTEFLGYDTETAEGQIVAIVADGKEVQSVSVGQKAQIIVNQTPFYGESGGQVGDTGLILGAKGKATVSDTQKKLGALFVHEATIDEGEVAVGDAVKLEVDHARRSMIRANHSATHLLHEALRQVLGDHIAQKGSLVEDTRLRFDFSHPKPMTADEIERVEDMANEYVLQNSPVTTRLMGLDDARASGARALFGEKYGDEVRVVAMGESGGNTMGWSVELCGGTHVRRTGDIGLISGLSDSGVAAGVRRVEALTGTAARKSAQHAVNLAKHASSELKTTLEELPARVVSLLDERKKLERELSDAKKKLAMGGGGGGASDAGVKTVGDIKLMARKVEGVEIKDLKSLVDDGKKQVGSGVVALVATSEDGKASVVVGVTADLTSRINAVDLVRKASEILGGRGGVGKPDMAQAGGPDGSKASEALKAIEAAIGG